MIELPAWFDRLRWSWPMSIDDLKKEENQGVIPDRPALYAVTAYFQKLRPRHVLYVGKAPWNLREQLPRITGPYNTNLPPGQRRKGRAVVFNARAAHTDEWIFVQWVVFRGGLDPLDLLEASLVHLLRPEASDRDEEAHPRRYPDAVLAEPPFLTEDKTVPAWMTNY